MGNSILKFNNSKTELLLLGSLYFIKENVQITITDGDSCIESTSAVFKLGAFFDEQCQLMYLFTTNVLPFKGNLESCTEFINAKRDT